MEVRSTKRDQGKSSYFSNQQTPLTSSAHYMYNNKVHPASISPVTFSTGYIDTLSGPMYINELITLKRLDASSGLDRTHFSITTNKPRSNA